MKTSNQEQEAEKFLVTVDSELARVAAEAVVDLDQTESIVKKHEATLQDGVGLLETVEAKSFLRALDESLFPGMTALGGTGNLNRQNHFRFERPRLQFQAKENYIREHGAELSARFEKLIAVKSKNRTAWRNKLADEYLALEKRRWLDGFYTLSAEQAKRLEQSEEALFASDSLYHEATRLAARMKTDPNLGALNEVRMYVGKLDFENTP
jgi:hypothetical protein